MDNLIKSIYDLQNWFIGLFPDYVFQSSHLAWLAFAVYLLLIIGGGVLAVLSSNLVRAMMGMVVTFLGVAGMYLLMASPFLAFMQILIYIGAICVLVFFAIMLVDNRPGGEESKFPPLKNIFYAFLAALLPFVTIAPLLIMHVGGLRTQIVPTETPLAELGENLLENYVLPFELISIVLLVAMAGAVLLAWKRRVAK